MGIGGNGKVSLVIVSIFSLAYFCRFQSGMVFSRCPFISNVLSTRSFMVSFRGVLLIFNTYFFI